MSVSVFGRIAPVVVVLVLGFMVLGGFVVPTASASHLYDLVRVSQGAATVENNPAIAFGPDGEVFVAYSVVNGGALDIAVRADQDGWMQDGVPIFTSFRIANDNPGTADWGFFDTVPLVYDPVNAALYTAWIDTRDMPTTGQDIRVGRSDNDGSSFGASTRVSDFTGVNSEDYPRLAVGPSGNVYALWVDDRDGNYDVFFSGSTDRGMTWSANVKLNDNTGAGDMWYPRIAVDAQERVFVTWSDFSGANLEVMFDRSLDMGGTWGTDQMIGSGTSDSWIADVAVGRSGVVHVAWQDTRANDEGIYYARSLDHGASWSLDGRVSWLGGGGDPLPRIATSADGLVYILWGDGGPPAEVAFAIYGEDGAIQFGLGGVTGGAQRYNLGTDANGNLFVVWSQFDGGANLEVYTAYFDAAPAAVTGLTATEPSAGTALVAWNPNTEIDLGYYLVYRTAPDGTFALYANVRAGTNTVAASGLADGRWTFTIIAVDRHGHASQPRAVSLDIGPSVDERFDQLDSEIAGLEADVRDLQNQSDGLQSDLDTANGNLDTANGTLGRLETQLGTMQTLVLVLLVVVILLSVVSLVLAMKSRKVQAPAQSWSPPPPSQ